jgi:hypothetical protein
MESLRKFSNLECPVCKSGITATLDTIDHLTLEAKNPESEKCYTVVWHTPSPKTYFAGYSLDDAIGLQRKLRAKHDTFLISIQREI